MNFIDALNSLVALLLAGGGILVIIILGLTQVVKQFGAKDKIALAANVIIGLVMGSLILVGSKGVPADVQGWIVLALFCLVCSLVASGIYKVAQPESITPQ